MIPLLDRLQQSEILLSDGALGSMLIDRGLKPGHCPEIWNLEQPETLTGIAKGYLEAGADILHTNTFGASPLKLADFGLDGNVEEINRTGVELVRSVVGQSRYVAASCGPTGKILQPYGDTNPEEIFQCYLRQMKVLIEAGVDVITIETMIDLREAVIAISAVRDISPQIPIIATLSFDKMPDGYATVMGASIVDAAKGLEQAGANVIGSNCGNGLENMIEIARGFAAATSLPIIIQSNAGLPEIKGGEIRYTESASFFKERTHELVEAGVSIIGGCCGTTPDYIRAMRAVLG